MSVFSGLLGLFGFNSRRAADTGGAAADGSWSSAPVTRADSDEMFATMAEEEKAQMRDYIGEVSADALWKTLENDYAASPRGRGPFVYRAKDGTPLAILASLGFRRGAKNMRHVRAIFCLLGDNSSRKTCFLMARHMGDIWRAFAAGEPETARTFISVTDAEVSRGAKWVTRLGFTIMPDKDDSGRNIIVCLRDKIGGGGK